MGEERRIRLTEEDGMEGGVRCPNCGRYSSFTDIVTTGQCSGEWDEHGCETRLALDLVVDP